MGLRIELLRVAAAAGPAGRGRPEWRLADAVEIVGLGAVGPVLALGGAEVACGQLGQGRAVIAAVAAERSGGLGLGPGVAFGRVRGLRRRRGGPVPIFLLRVEEGVLLQHLRHFLVQLERGHLQQLDRLLQLRRQRQMLCELELQGGAHPGHILKCSPR